MVVQAAVTNRATIPMAVLLAVRFFRISISPSFSLFLVPSEHFIHVSGHESRGHEGDTLAIHQLKQ
jgi:hypothetical protein